MAVVGRLVDLYETISSEISEDQSLNSQGTTLQFVFDIHATIDFIVCYFVRFMLR